MTMKKHYSSLGWHWSMPVCSKPKALMCSTNRPSVWAIPSTKRVYQVIYDLSYVYGNHHKKQGTNTNRITEQMLLQIGNLYSAFYSYPIFQRDSLIYSNMKKGIESNFSGNSGTINWKLYKNYPQQGKTAYLDFLLPTDICA